MADPTSSLEAVSDSNEVSPEEQAALDVEQAALDAATNKAQMNYLGARISELVRENVALKREVETLKKRRK